MISQRRQWRQQELQKAVRNIFETQMHTRMRRQSLKQAEIREPRDIEDCVTLDLGSARSRDIYNIQEQQATDRVNEMTTTQPDNDLVLKVRQLLTGDAKFRLERLGGLDVARAVPTFEYRVFMVAGDHSYSGDATERSSGVYRFPRLLHNSRVNLPPRPAYYFV
ncbi:hypothetical protein PHMEG_00033896 [Phytophthora megakarya]|uniref:Uncharacterized protein n=1 Tax=Phytophthora megakarya TaxID=4795 RepID=A0A225UUP3_9STRA|nr:hypothetical protein PHMEG_00033896 [Phytophthora megakarya]